MELIEHIVFHSIEDTLPLVPFLFITYLALEALEHMAGDRAGALVRRAGAAGPVIGAVLGIVPQCGFSAMGATLYAGRVITLGTLAAVFLSTSDEMLPLLVAEQVDAGTVVQILLVKAAIAAVVGLAVDACLRALRKNARAHEALRRGVLGQAAGASSDAPDLIDELSEAGEGAGHIHRLCERDHCGCEDVGPGDAGRMAPVSCGDERENIAPGAHAHDHDGGEELHEHHHHSGAIAIVRSALSHTVQVTVFIYVVTLLLVAVLETVGEPALAAFLAGNEALAVIASALVGLIPNCAASVVVTQLYLEGVLSFNAMIAGTLVGAGTGFLVLFRTNRSARENLVILLLLLAVGVASGFALGLVGF